jgi:hypothetical protein
MSHLSQAGDDLSGVPTRKEVAQLLGAYVVNPFVPSEEQRHPWSINKSQELDRPLMRIWDMNSGSRPNEDGRMLSRLPHQPLNTEQARKTFLTTHLDHSIWEPTPYISFTTSASAIEDLAAWRSMKRGDQTLTAINPATRLRNGLPTLDVAAEMDYYEIPDPYNKGSKYYINHYVCLWGVAEEEIIGHYEWEELSKSSNWYEEVIMPAFYKSDGGKKPESDLIRASAFDMSMMIESLPSKSLTNAGTYAANNESCEQFH